MASSEPPSYMDVDQLPTSRSPFSGGAVPLADDGVSEEEWSAHKRPRCLDKRLDCCTIDERGPIWTPSQSRMHLAAAGGEDGGPLEPAAKATGAAAVAAGGESACAVSLFLSRQPSGCENSQGPLPCAPRSTSTTGVPGTSLPAVSAGLLSSLAQAGRPCGTAVPAVVTSAGTSAAGAASSSEAEGMLRRTASSSSSASATAAAEPSSTCALAALAVMACKPGGGSVGATSCVALTAVVAALGQGQQQPGGCAAAAISSSSWCDLPDDLLKRVLTHLHPSYLRVFRLVCRSWEQMACRFIRSLKPERLSSTAASGSSSGRPLAQRFPFLQSLDLSDCVNVVHCHRANELRLRSALTDPMLACVTGLARLTDVNLRGCSTLTGEGLAHVCRLPCLRKLDLSGCSALTDAGASHLSTASSLVWLSLRGCRLLSDPGLAEVLAGLTGLRQLCLAGCVNLTDEGLVCVAPLTNLQRLNLDRCTAVGDPGLRLVASSLAKLRHLSLAGCRRVSGRGLALLCSLPRMESLDISGCLQVDGSALQHLAQLATLRLLITHDVRMVQADAAAAAVAAGVLAPALLPPAVAAPLP